MIPTLKTHFVPKRRLSEAVVNHKTPHKGNLILFYDANNLEAVCWSCHLGAIQSVGALGYDTEIGVEWLACGCQPS